MRISDWSSDVCSSDLDALVGMDHQHVLADIETVDRADLDAVHVFALDAGFGHDVGHGCLPRSMMPAMIPGHAAVASTAGRPDCRSEERRVGKGCVGPCRSRWSPYNYKKKKRQT